MCTHAPRTGTEGARVAWGLGRRTLLAGRNKSEQTETYFRQKNSYRLLPGSDSCLTFAPFLRPTVYKPTLPHPPIPSPNPKRDCPLPLSHRCRTRHLWALRQLCVPVAAAAAAAAAAIKAPAARTRRRRARRRRPSRAARARRSGRAGRGGRPRARASSRRSAPAPPRRAGARAHR